MAFMDDEPVKKQKAFVVGQDVALFSIAELTDTIAALKAEITRLEAAINAKQGTRASADSLFKF
jgi:uncharacterized small protein (DUF1192 family)